MKQAGRKSAASLSVVQAQPISFLQPPSDLTVEEATVWARVVATKPGDWFDAGSVPMLAQYCRAVVQSELVSGLVESTGKAMLTDPDELNRYKELRKIQSGLSSEILALGRSMRLTQQSRYHAKNSDTASRKANGSKPWHHDVIDG